MKRLFLLAQAIALLIALAPPPVAAATTPVAANPKDVASIGTIIGALYATISGPKGQPRNWNRFRSLFAPDARLIAVVRHEGAAPVVRSITVERYIALDDAIMVQKGFFESETGRQIMEFHGIASVFSGYAGRFEGGPVFDRGINNIQLFFDGKRWYIVSVYWDTAP
jgi:hypothetical protein